MGLLTVLNWHEIRGDELLITNQNSSLTREKLRKTVEWTYLKWEIRSRGKKRKQPLLENACIIIPMGVLGLKIRQDHSGHEQTGEKAMSQFPWSLGGVDGSIRY